MKCAQVQDMISRYLDGDLDRVAKAMFDEHLASCRACAKELRQVKEMIAELKRVPEVEPPPYFVEAVRHRLEQKPSWKTYARRLFVPLYVKIPLEALAVTATAIVVMFLFQKTELKSVLAPQVQRAQARQQKYEVTKKDEFAFDFKQEAPQEYAPLPSMYQDKAVSTAPVMLGSTDRKSERLVMEKAKEAPSSSQAEGLAYQHEAAVSASPASGAQQDFQLTKLPPASSRVSAETVSSLRKEERQETLMIESGDLEQDAADLQAILKDFGIKNITRIVPVDKTGQIIFTFSVSSSQFPQLVLRIDSWRKVVQQAAISQPETGAVLVTVILNAL